MPPDATTKSAPNESALPKASVAIEVNGRRIEAVPGEMLIAATDRAGIYIPRFCYHHTLSIAANCRMCLVDVEKAPKPLPACATPVADGMVVRTHSELAREAQQGTLEFLLINHPLDCPVCDQGGECPLQDQAMGYGSEDSRFRERKRAVASHDIGPLVATEMTRCIHCTRCVRFGEEIAGAMEMGMPGRGEAAHIATFLNRSVDSEVSGNMIDLCPVGALTSKPYRFAARAWELASHRGVSPHDCVGANLAIQTLRDRVERVLPRDNEQVNQCWLADRDRYSYESINSERRLTAPMICDNGEWKQASWESALARARDGLRAAIESGGDDQLGVLAGGCATLEEYHLLQKLARALGCDNIDHRLQQCDFRDDGFAQARPGSELPIADYDRVRAALLVGSNLRKEQPLLALRLRAATRPMSHDSGARVHCINPLAYEQNFAARTLAAGAELPAHLAAVAAAVAGARDHELPDDIRRWVNGDDEHDHHHAIARDLIDAGDGAIIVLGALAQQHPDASVLRAIARWIRGATGARLCVLPPGNGVAAWRANCLPRASDSSRRGRDAAAMIAEPRRAYLLLATEPELDGIDGASCARALRDAELAVRIAAYRPPPDAAVARAEVLLPMAAFAETAGTYINCEGRAQQAMAAASPRGESRPGWKILRVLGNFLDLPGFDQVSLREVTDEIALDATDDGDDDEAWSIPSPRGDNDNDNDDAVRRLLDVPMYRGDMIVRNASALQRTADNPPPTARMRQAMIDRLGLADGDEVVVRNGAGDDDDGVARLALRADARVPHGCVYVPAGHAQTAPLGAHGAVTLERAR
ncbi:MAG: NADH-quinone oxidoreductase subunit NuoG [bacterium]